MTEYPIVEVLPDEGYADEPMGTKAKFWCTVAGRSCLFKMGREGTGENWAEKVSSELASLLGLPHAEVDLAVCGGTRGIVSYNCLPSRTATHVYGNQLLRRTVPGYPPPKEGHGHRRSPEHSVQNVYEILKSESIYAPRASPDEIALAREAFVGYLLFDAWIGNTDRHDENWALVVELPESGASGVRISLSPTFDHASSLGRELTDSKREGLLARPGGVANYTAKCRSALYADATDSTPLTTVDAFAALAERAPQAATYWRERLARLDSAAVSDCIERLPDDWATRPAKQFAFAVLEENRKRLLAQ